MKYKTVIFDFDSTLVTIEGIDELARMKGVYSQVSQLTAQAMDGDIPFEKVFFKRLYKIQPQQSDLHQLAQLYQKNLTPGTIDLIQQLILNKCEILIISGGYSQAILPTIKALGLPSSSLHAVSLLPNGQAMTKIGANQVLTRSSGKYALMSRIPFDKPAVFIGDGTTDTIVKPLVDTFIGFGGVSYRPQVEKVSDHYIRSPNINSVYNYLN